MQGGVQEGWAASDNVDGGSAGVEGGAGRGASRRSRHRARGRRGGCGKAVRRARAAVVSAMAAAASAGCELCLIGAVVHAKMDARVRAARRDSFFSVWFEGGRSEVALAEFDVALAQAQQAAEREVDAAYARACATLGAMEAAQLALRDAVSAADRRKQIRSAGRGLAQEPLGVCADGWVPPTHSTVQPLSLGLASVGERCRERAGNRQGVCRRGRSAAGRLRRRAVPAGGGRGGCLEGSGGAARMPAAWARLRRARGARGRQLRRCAPGWQQVGQPTGRPPGCHRGAGCPLGRDKLGMGPWLGDGC